MPHTPNSDYLAPTLNELAGERTDRRARIRERARRRARRAIRGPSLRGGLPQKNPAALVASMIAIFAERASTMHTVVVDPRSSVHACRGDVHFDSLEGVHASAVGRLVSGQGAMT